MTSRRSSPTLPQPPTTTHQPFYISSPTNPNNKPMHTLSCVVSDTTSLRAKFKKSGTSPPLMVAPDGRDVGGTSTLSLGGLLAVVPWPSTREGGNIYPTKTWGKRENHHRLKFVPLIERGYICDVSSQEGIEPRNAWRPNVRWKKGARKLHWLLSSKGFWTDECVAFQNLMSHRNQKNHHCLLGSRAHVTREEWDFSKKWIASHVSKKGSILETKGGGSSFPIIKQ